MTARSDVLCAVLQLYINTVQQEVSHPCRWTPRLAHGVPEGSKRSHPKTKQNQNNHAVQKGGNATIEAYEVVGWWGKEKTTSDSSDLTAPSQVHYKRVCAERGEMVCESKAQVTQANRCEQQ